LKRAIHQLRLMLGIELAVKPIANVAQSLQIELLLALDGTKRMFLRATTSAMASVP
jgi:hypothetical protein